MCVLWALTVPFIQRQRKFQLHHHPSSKVDVERKVQFSQQQQQRELYPREIIIPRNLSLAWTRYHHGSPHPSLISCTVIIAQRERENPIKQWKAMVVFMYERERDQFTGSLSILSDLYSHRLIKCHWWFFCRKRSSNFILLQAIPTISNRLHLTNWAFQPFC